MVVLVLRKWPSASMGRIGKIFSPNCIRRLFSNVNGGREVFDTSFASCLQD